MKLQEILTGIIEKRDKKREQSPPRHQVKGPIYHNPTAIAVCAPCTEIQKAANPLFKGEVGWPAKDLERHLREYHLVGRS